MVEASTIIAGIKQFGLAPDGSDLRDLEVGFADRERQIAELRADNERLQNEWDNCDEMLQSVRAENARLRALPLKDVAERVLDEELCTRLEFGADNIGASLDADECRQVVALLSRLRAGEHEGWRPIETAPKDGSQVDLWCRSPGISGGGYARIPDCWYSSGRWWRYDENGDDQCREKVHNVTHWMPRPAAPSEQGGDRNTTQTKELTDD